MHHNDFACKCQHQLATSVSIVESLGKKMKADETLRDGRLVAEI